MYFLVLFILEYLVISPTTLETPSQVSFVQILCTYLPNTPRTHLEAAGLYYLHGGPSINRRALACRYRVRARIHSHAVPHHKNNPWISTSSVTLHSIYYSIYSSIFLLYPPYSAPAVLIRPI